MREVYEHLKNCIRKIDFKVLWKGFHPFPFAIYTKSCVWLEDEEIPWNESFIGNTTIFYQGEYIAIWNLENDSPESLDYESLCASIVHEMFHAYQMTLNETRYPNDLQTLCYPLNQRNFEYKFEENKLLARAFAESELQEKRRLLNLFFCIRKLREEQIGQAIQCEYGTETAEGMAVYVQCKALRQLDDKKYLQETERYTKLISTADMLQFDIRKISYYVGAILLLTAEDAGMPIGHQIGSTKIPVSKLLAVYSVPVSVEEISNPQISTMLSECIKGREQEIGDTQSKCNDWIHGEFYITGYDPMNMMRNEDMILCKHFIRLTDCSTEKSVTLFGKTILWMKQDSINVVTAYRTE